MFLRPYILVPQLMSLLLMAAFMVGCQRRCQAPPDEAFKNLSETEWRFVESTNPGFQTMDNYTFLVLGFKSDFSCEVFSVDENRRTEAPQRICRWKADRDRNRLTVAYSSPESELDEESTSVSGEMPTIVEYTYRLGRDLKLTEAQSGFYYRLVPMLGIVEPDNSCTF